MPDLQYVQDQNGNNLDQVTFHSNHPRHGEVLYQLVEGQTRAWECTQCGQWVEDPTAYPDEHDCDDE